MAAANKPTGVHVTLIIFVMASIIFGVMWYMEMGERKAARAEADKAKREASTNKTALDNRDEDLTEVMKWYGVVVPLDKIGRGAPPEETGNLLGGIQTDVKTYGKDLGKLTARAVLMEQSQKINTLTQEKNNLQAQLNDSQAKVLSLGQEMQARVDQFDQAAKTEAERAGKATQDLDETIKSKNQVIDDLNKRVSEERVLAEANADRLQKQIDKLSKDIAAMNVANNKLQDDLQAAKQYSFEVPDGVIRWVDHASKLVWINLGEADRLPKKTSFSVYTKAHHGVARGSEDVKGAIEVTRILGPHLAEARILQSDDLRPIAVEDPIYTPLWSAGKVEYFVFVGKIDFDGDGRDDRARMHEMVTASGAKIDGEVDDNGNLNGPGVSVRTRFLVVGDIPSPLTSQLTQAEVEASNKMMKLHEDLVAQARQQGVRVVSLNDFLNYIGYTSTRRMWAPGEHRPYALKTQQAPLAIDEVVPERTHATRNRKNVTGSGARMLDAEKKVKEKKEQIEKNRNDEK